MIPFLLLITSIPVHAQLIQILDCNTLFGNGAQNAVSAPLITAGIASRTVPTELLGISLIISLLVLSLLGIVYTIGTAFGITKLVTFVKTEYLESIANVAIVVLIIGGIGVFNGSTVFLANLASASTTGATSSHLGFVSARQLYTNLCTNYQNNIVMNGIYTYVDVFYDLFIYNMIIDFKINVMPLDFGIKFGPLYGAQTLRTAVWSEMDITFSIIVMGMLLIFTLFIIYFLFPIFLYAGIALRAFPWTRAAGGALIALFISFYVIFPAFLYAFSSYTFSSASSSSAICKSAPTLCHETGSSNVKLDILGDTFSVLETFVSSFVGFAFGDVMFQNVMQYASTITYIVFQMAGLIISFIIAYDMLEFLGDILGAPSLQSGKLLQKVI